MTFAEAKNMVLSGRVLYAYLKFKKTIVRMSKIKENEVLIEISKQSYQSIYNWSNWEKIKEKPEYTCRIDWNV